METASTSGALTASVMEFHEMAESARGRRLQTVPVRRAIIRGNGHETGFVKPRSYDPCFGARTFIPCRFTATSIFSAGFDDGGRPYVTTS